MKKTTYFLYFILVHFSLFGASFNFKTPTKLDFRISSYTYFLDDVNNDGIEDVYCYLVSGSPSDPATYDSTIKNGTYLSIRDAQLKLKPVYSFKDKTILGLYDFNNDGKKDVLVSNYTFIEIYYRTDSATFVNKIIYTAPGIAVPQLKVDDIDNDGRLDIYVANYSSLMPAHKPFILYQPKIDSFIPYFLPSHSVVGFLEGAFKSVDLNNDNKKDLLLQTINTSSFKSKYLIMYLQTDSGTFNIVYKLVFNFPVDIEVFDQNHDGKNDLIIEAMDPASKTALYVYHQTTNGNFTLKYQSSTTETCTKYPYDDEVLKVADLNCDGFQELFRVSCSSIYNCYIYDSKNDSTYSKPYVISFPYKKYPLYATLDALIDWDLDGKKDLILYADNTTYWSKNSSINDQTILQFYKTTKDTVNRFFDPKTGIQSYYIKTVPTGFYYDTNTVSNTLYNPLSKKYEIASILTIKKMFTAISMDYYIFDIYRNNYSLYFGMFCNGIINDTFYNRTFIDSFYKYTRIDSNFILYSEIVTQETKFSSALNDFPLLNSTFKIFPNPATEYFEIQSDVTSIIPRLYDLRGKEIPIVQNERDQFMIGHIPGGIYIVSVYINGVHNIQKLVIKK